MVGFHAQALPLEPEVGDELEQARWFSVDEIDAAVASGEIQLSPKLSIARWLVDDWMEAARERQASGFQA
jgi:NAD+ diphosphatase